MLVSYFFCFPYKNNAIFLSDVVHGDLEGAVGPHQVGHAGSWSWNCSNEALEAEDREPCSTLFWSMLTSRIPHTLLLFEP